MDRRAIAASTLSGLTRGFRRCVSGVFQVVGRQGSQVTVFFIDYGDREDTSVSNLFPLSPEFTQLPQLGERLCQLSAVCLC